jgi:hypothetical protein
MADLGECLVAAPPETAKVEVKGAFGVGFAADP